jgi:O-antigen/teichoic acid export membrane protein
VSRLGERGGGWPAPAPRVVTFAWNLSTRYVLIVVSVLLGIAVLPFNLRYLGEADYGLLTLVASVTTYFSVFELGYGGAVIRYVAELRARRDPQALNEVLSTMFYVFSVIGALTYALAIAIALLLPAIFNIAPEQVRDGQIVLLIIAVHVAMHFVFNVYGGVINGFELYYINNIVGVAFNVAAALANLLVLWMGYGIVELVAATTLIRVVPYAIYRRNAHRAFPELQIRHQHFRWHRLRELTGFSAYLAVIDWSARLAYTTDVFLLGVFLNTTVVALYAVAQRLAEALLRMTNQLQSFLFPAVVTQAVDGDVEDQRRLFVRATRFQVAVAIAMCGSVAAVSDVLIRAWIGPGYDASASVLRVLAAVVVARTLMSMPSTVLKGTGHHRFVAIASAWCAVASLLLSIAAVKLFGMPGVAWGALVPALVLSAGVVFPHTCRVVRLGVWQGYRQILWPAAWPAVLAIAVMSGGRHLAPPTLVAVLGYMACGALLYAALFVLFGLDRDERQWFVSTSRTIVARAAGARRRPPRTLRPAAALESGARSLEPEARSVP